MNDQDYVIELEQRRHQPGVRNLLTAAFGPTRLQRVIYTLRDGVPPDPSLCFVMVNSGGDVFGIVRNYRVRIGDYPKPVLLLGPIAVAQSHERNGFARRLIDRSIEVARDRGVEMIYLVGDPGYYGDFGFKATLAAQIQIEGLESGKIVLGLELQPHAAFQYSGIMQKDESVVLEQLAEWQYQ